MGCRCLLDGDASLGVRRVARGRRRRRTPRRTARAGRSARAVAVLLVSAGAVGWLSEILVGSTEEAIKHIGLSEMFVGLIVVPIIGNAAEHSSAVLMAMRNRMDLAVSIAVGSSAQVALLIAPVLVFVGLAFGRPMDLAFSTFEVDRRSRSRWPWRPPWCAMRSRIGWRGRSCCSSTGCSASRSSTSDRRRRRRNGANPSGIAV